MKWAAAPDGIPIHYVEEGSGGVPLVLVHGWSCDLTFWREQIGPLSRHAADYRLGPAGPWPKRARRRCAIPRSVSPMAVVAVMDRAGIEKAVLVGHSMGLTVIWQAALLHPERVAGLINVDGAVFDVPADEEGAQAWKTEMDAFVESFRGPEGEAFTAGFIDSMHGRDTRETLKKEVREKMLATPPWVAAFGHGGVHRSGCLAGRGGIGSDPGCVCPLR